jgi:hypothetical protein
MLKTISVIDVRVGGTVRHAIDGADRARGLRDECLSCFPRPVRALVPFLDGLARRWLTRARAPFVDEIAEIAGALGFRGVWLLNGSYQWGCTTMARNEGAVPWLARTLDWPFPGLGHRVEVARQSGPAGEYFNVTWPGYVGALTAMAPGRFGAALNQAPLRRRTRHPWLRPYDMAANARSVWKMRHIPPDQLLRHAMANAGDFTRARELLETTPVARPVLYTLAGMKPGEHCVIERTEDGFVTHDDGCAIANDWRERRDNWEARIASRLLLTISTDDAAMRSRNRSATLQGFSGPFGRGEFAWVTEPVLNPYTRLAVEMCPAAGILRVRGYENVPGQMLPQPATEVLEIGAESMAA